MMADETHWCWSQCCDRGPHGCICGNGCPPPSEPTVQVPVSLIEGIGDHVAREYEADPALDAMVLEVRALLSQPTATAEPLRIEDMAPGTTFSAEGHDGTDRFCAVANLDHTIADLDDCVFRADDWFDPSTIRDVTPPAAT